LPGPTEPPPRPADEALLARLRPATPTAWHRLNPLTRAVVSIVVTVAAVAIGGYATPLILLAFLVVPAAHVAGVLPRATRLALGVSLPIIISVALVSILTRPGETVLLGLGPLRATLEGVDFAAQVSLRVIVMALILILFALTTEPRAIVADLERRGVPPRLTFAIAAALDAVPAMVARARAVASAQRARGLDTEGSVGARLRGVRALVGPVVLSSLAEVEERATALDARGFGRPGKREPLWVPDEADWERPARWLLLAGLLVAIVARAFGPLAGLP
jgi:energy-coupling factor transport system permease protein